MSGVYTVIAVLYFSSEPFDQTPPDIVSSKTITYLWQVSILCTISGVYLYLELSGCTDAS